MNLNCELQEFEFLLYLVLENNISSIISLYNYEYTLSSRNITYTNKKRNDIRSSFQLIPKTYASGWFHKASLNNLLFCDSADNATFLGVKINTESPIFC